MFGWFWNIVTKIIPPVDPVKSKAMGKYAETYFKAQIRPEREWELSSIGKKIVEGRPRYEAVGGILAIPWWFIGITHFMEAGAFYPKHFNYHLHCGDPLTSRTVHVPKGRPKADPAAGTGKPYTWEESAIDALRFMGYDKINDWSLENCLVLFEKFNGMGYKKRGVPSPYLWSFTTEYIAGKYVADGKYDPKAVSKQPGCAAIMKILGIS